MNMMKYKSYQAKVEFSQADGVLVGEVCDIDALILFSADSVPALEAEFKSAIEGYLKDCADRAVTPEKPCSGTFNVRVGGELHRKAAGIARSWGVSLNQVVCSALEQVVDRHCQQSPVAHSRIVEHPIGFAGYDDLANVQSERPSAYGYN